MSGVLSGAMVPKIQTNQNQISQRQTLLKGSSFKTK